jgi:hypothetical protein
MAVRLVLHSTEHALVAQWREQRFPKPRVAGSIPAGGTPSTSTSANPGWSEEGIVAVSLPSADEATVLFDFKTQPARGRVDC